jgi:hypothetical protein
MKFGSNGCLLLVIGVALFVLAVAYSAVATHH